MNHPGMKNNFSKEEKQIFEWSEDNFKKIREIISKYPNGKQQSAVIFLKLSSDHSNNCFSSLEKLFFIPG